MTDTICIKDNETIIYITYQDMLKYHGRSYIAGVAMAFKLLELSLSELTANGIASRDEITVMTSANGPGIIDGLEMVTRARTQGRLTVDQHAAKYKDAPDAADGQGGKYYFEVTCRGKRMALTLNHHLVPPVFLELAYKVHNEAITNKEIIRLQELKEEIAASLMSSEAKNVFTFKLV